MYNFNVWRTLLGKTDTFKGWRNGDTQWYIPLIQYPLNSISYKDMSEDSDKYDFSGYDEKHEMYDPRNKKVVGKMKDECNGKLMTEFIGIRSKMYCYQVEEKVEKKGKGIKKHLLKNELRMDHYRDCIMEEKVFKCARRRRPWSAGFRQCCCGSTAPS